MRRLFSSPAAIARLLLFLLLALDVALLAAGPSLKEANAEAAAFLAEGGSPDQIHWEIDVARGLHYAAWINLVLLTLLLATAGWWTRPFADPSETTPPARPGTPRWFWVGLLIVMGLGIHLRLPLARGSLWWDELWSIRQVSHGNWKPDDKTADPDDWRFSVPDWKRTAFYYQKPTNHVPMSLLQRISLDGWRAVTGQPRSEFLDLAARLPALAASALAIFLAGLVSRSWGWRAGACLAAPLLLALHPLAIRYGVDARAYALVMPLALATLLAAGGIVRSSGRRWGGFVLLGSSVFLWLWSFPHGLLDVCLIAAVLAGVLVFRNRTLEDRLTALMRLGVSYLLAAMAMLQLFLPCFLQARRWMAADAHAHLLDATELQNSLAMLLTGLPWSDPAVQTDLGAGLTDLQHLWGTGLVGGTVALLLAAGVAGGLALSLRRGRRERGQFLLLSLLASAAVFGLACHLTEAYFYTRFWIALVPVIVLSLAALMDHARIWRYGIAAVALITAVHTYQHGGTLLQQRPIEPVHDVVRAMRDLAPEATWLAYGHGYEAVRVYEPRALPLHDATELEAALAEAAADVEPPLLVVGHIGFNRAVLGTGFAIIENPERFEEIKRFGGISAEHQYRLYRARR